MGNRGDALERPRRVVFVAGVSRSGSTLLDFILGNRPGGLALGEIYAWYRPFRDHHLDPQCTCGEPWFACPVWQRVGHPKARHLHRTLADALALTVVVDSSKSLHWIRDAYRWAAADGMEPHVVLSWRPPQAIAYSYWKRRGLAPAEHFAFGTSTPVHPRKPPWMTNLEGYVRRLDNLKVGYHVLAFDHLIRDPATTLDQLHAGMGMESWPGQERFWEGDYHSMYGSGGTKEQLHAQSARLEEPELPAAFLDYWDRLPIVWREGLDELNTRILSRGRVPASPRRVPPAWYVKRRCVAYKQEVRVRWAGRQRRTTGD